jgi:hypothetical protein
MREIVGHSGARTCTPCGEARRGCARSAGTTAAKWWDMPQKSPPVPRSYDEIVRRTVPQLDSSWSPTEEQERDAYAGKHVYTPEEEALLHRVSEALLDTPGIDMCGIEVDVDDRRVTLRGHCANITAIDRVVRAVSSMEEVSDVVDRLVVESG